MNKTARTQLVRTCDSSLAKGEIIRQLDDKVYRYFISSKVSEDIKPDETSIIKELIQFVRDNSSEIWHHPVIDNITDMPYTLSQLLKFSYLEDIEQKNYQEIHTEIIKLSKRLKGILQVTEALLERGDLWNNKRSPAAFGSFDREELYNLALEVEALYGRGND